MNEEENTDVPQDDVDPSRDEGAGREDDVDTHEFEVVSSSEEAVSSAEQRSSRSAVLTATMAGICAVCLIAGFVAGRMSVVVSEETPQPKDVADGSDEVRPLEIEPSADAQPEPDTESAAEQEPPDGQPPAQGPEHEYFIDIEEREDLIDYAEKHKLDPELLFGVRMTGFDVHELEMLERQQKRSKLLMGDLLVLRGLGRRGDKGQIREISEALRAKGQWNKRTDELLALDQPPFSEEDIRDLWQRMNRYKKQNIPVAELLKARRRFTWNDIDAMASAVQRTKVKFSTFAQVLRTHSREDVQHLAYLLKKTNDVDSVLKLFDLEGREGSSRIVPLAAKYKIKLPKLVGLAEKHCSEDIQKAAYCAQRHKMSTEEVLKLQAGDSWSEVQRLLDSARRWKMDMQLVKKLWKDYSREDIEQAWRLANHEKGPDGVGLKVEDVLKMRDGKEWDDVRRVFEDAKKYGYPLDRVAGLVDEVGSKEAHKLLNNQHDWKEPLDDLIELREEFGWEDLERAKRIAEKHGGQDKPLLLKVVTDICRRGDWNKVESIVELANSCEVPVDEVLKWAADCNRSEIGRIASYAQKWKLEPEFLFRQRKRLSWDAIRVARDEAESSALLMADVCDIAAEVPEDKIDNAVEIAVAGDLKPAEVLELRERFAWDELDEAMDVAKDEKIPLRKVLRLRRVGFSWDRVAEVLQPVE